MRDLQPIYQMATDAITTASQNLMIYDPYLLYEKIVVTYAARRVIAIYVNTDVDTETTYLALQALLAEVFSIVQGTDLIIAHKPNSLLGRLLLAIAEHISIKLGVNRYSLLMPSLTVMHNVVTGTNFQTDNPPFTNILLSDDGSRIIEVLECLTLAEEDGILKHTSLSDNDAVLLLTPLEKHRVIHHSSYTRAYWNAIEHRVKIVNNGLTIGSMLYKLSNQLQGGGVERMSRAVPIEMREAVSRLYERNAGEPANLGIQEFFTWYNQQGSLIQAKIRSFAMKSIKFDERFEISIGEIIDRLADPVNPANQDARYCVEMLSTYIRIY